MQVARVTSKGQVTLPKAIREALRVERGDLLIFAPRQEGYVELRRLPGRTLSQLHGALAVSRSVAHTRERMTYRRALAKRLKHARGGT